MGESGHKYTYILAADAVGFSRLVSQSEEATLKDLRICFDIFYNVISEYKGRVFHSAGDSILAEFLSAVDAVNASLKIQTKIFLQNQSSKTKSKLIFRIGIDCGNVRIDGDNLLGEAVNFAARLESFAQAGGISISKTIRNELGNLNFVLTNHGLVRIKNSNIHAYDIRLNHLKPRKFLNPFKKFLLCLYLTILLVTMSAFLYGKYFLIDDRYFRIAVIPFQNSSQDPEYDYVALGLSNEITQSLSVVSNLNLISRSSSAQYRDLKLNYKQVKKDLALTHLVTGKLNSSGQNVTLKIYLHNFANDETKELISLSKPLSAILETKDRIVESVIRGLDIKISKTDREKVYYVDTVDMLAFEEFLKGDLQFGLRTAAGREAAAQHFHKAIMIDPTFARAYGYLAILNARLVEQIVIVDLSSREKARAKQLAEIFARTAMVIGPNVPEVNFARAFVSYFIEKDFKSALTFVNQAIDLNPNYADAVALRAVVENKTNPEKGLNSITKAMSMNPRHTVDYLAIKAQSLSKLERFKDLKSISEKMLEREPNFINAHIHLILAETKLGNHEDAAWAIQELLMVNPHFTLTEHFKGKEKLKSYKLYNEIFDKADIPQQYR